MLYLAINQRRCVMRQWGISGLLWASADFTFFHFDPNCPGNRCCLSLIQFCFSFWDYSPGFSGTVD